MFTECVRRRELDAEGNIVATMVNYREYSFAGVVHRPSLMEAYAHLRLRRGRTGHGPKIPSGVLCLGHDSYPSGAVVGAVINVDGVAAGVLSTPVDVLVVPDRPNFSAVRSVELELRPALHSEVGVALVCDRPIFLQQDFYPALSGREIVDSPPIAERERRDVLRDPEQASSTVPAVLDYQVVAVRQVGVVPV